MRVHVTGHLEVLFWHALPRGYRPEGPGDVRDSQADSGHLREVFPTVEASPFVDSLRSTVAWMSGQPLAAGMAGPGDGR